MGLVGLYMTVVGSAVAFGTIALRYRAPTELEKKPLGSFAKLSRRELWLILVAGLMWMLINGAYLVFLSIGPTLLLERGTSIAESGSVVY